MFKFVRSISCKADVGASGGYSEIWEEALFMRKAVILSALLAVSMFTACAGNGKELPVEESDTSTNPIQQEEAVSPKQMGTEEQLRDGLAAAGSAPEEKLAFYEELLARDLCKEEDYLEMAQLYAASGDDAAQRRMLWWAFRLYPDEKYAQLLSNLAVRYTPEEEEAAALVTALQQALTEKDVAALRAVIEGEEWRETFQEAPEIFATRTRYESENLTAQIVSDAYETEVYLLAGDGTCLYGRVNGGESRTASAVFTEGAYNGEAEVCWYDGEGTRYKRYQAVLHNDVCVDSLSVEYEGASYEGTFGEDGSVMEKQQEKVTGAGGVVYAYEVGGKRYLYREGVSQDTFRMDCEMLGLPRLEVWE